MEINFCNNLLGFKLQINDNIGPLRVIKSDFKSDSHAGEINLVKFSA